MAFSLIKRLPQRIAPFLNETAVSSSIRTLFTPNRLSVTLFEEKKRNVLEDLDKDKIKKQFKEALTKSSISLGPRDFKHMVYASTTDEDVELVLNALKHHTKLNEDGNFNFQKDFMSMLYTLNKVDTALQLLNDDSSRNCILNMSSLTIIGTKLFIEGRYTDLVKLFIDVIEKPYFKTMEDGSLFIPRDMTTLFIASLYKLNNEDAVKILRQYLPKIKSESKFLQGRSTAFGILLAFNQNDAVLARQLFDLFQYGNAKNSILLSLKVLVLKLENKLEEAVDVFSTILKQYQNESFNSYKVYPITIRVLSEAVERSNNENLKSQFEEIKNKFEELDAVKKEDLDEHFLKPQDTLPLKTGEGNQKRSSFNDYRDFASTRDNRQGQQELGLRWNSNRDTRQGNQDNDTRSWSNKNRDFNSGRENRQGQQEFGSRPNFQFRRPDFQGQQDIESRSWPNKNRKSQEGQRFQRDSRIEQGSRQNRSNRYDEDAS